MKRILGVLLAVLLLTVPVLSPAEGGAAAEETAETVSETAGTETVAPELLVTVNGEEILTDNNYMNNVINYYLDYAQSSGYDVSDEELMDTIRQYSLMYTIRTILLRQKAAELGLADISEDEQAVMEEGARAEWQQIIDYYVEQSGEVTDASTEDEKAAAKADAEAMLLLYGYDEESYVQEYIENETENLLTDRIRDMLTADETVTDEDIQSYFDDLVAEDREAYENDVGSYEFYTQYYQQPSYYTPEGYRAVTHILLDVDEELMNTWKDLSARLEEQQSAAESEPVEDTESAETEEPAADAEPTEEPEPTAEPVTAEMVAAAEQAILDSVQPVVDEIMAKLDAGASFDDLIKEYGQDPGMQDDARRAEGYAVHPDSILWDPAFTAAALALEKVGDVGQPVVGQYGVHILHYLRDIAGGAVELTDEMKEEFRGILTEEMKSEALNSALDQWQEEAEIVYTEAGEAWKIPEEDLSDEEIPDEDLAEEETPDEAAQETPAP